MDQLDIFQPFPTQSPNWKWGIFYDKNYHLVYSQPHVTGHSGQTHSCQPTKYGPIKIFWLFGIWGKFRKAQYLWVNFNAKCNRLRFRAPFRRPFWSNPWLPTSQIWADQLKKNLKYNSEWKNTCFVIFLLQGTVVWTQLYARIFCLEFTPNNVWHQVCKKFRQGSCNL